MFRFYFQYGDFADGGTDLFKDVLIPFLAAAIPVVLFLWQLSIQRKEQFLTRVNIEKDKLKYLNHLILGCKAFTTSYIKGLESAINKINEDPGYLEGYSVSQWDDLIRVTSTINQEEHFHAYLNRVGNEKIRNVFGTLDYINLSRIQTDALFVDARENDNRRKKEFQKIIVLTIKELKRNCHSLDNNELHSGILNSLLQDYRNILSKNPLNYGSLKDDFLEPLHATLETFNLPKYKELIDYAFAANLLIVELVKNNSVVASSLNNDLTQVVNANKTLIEYSSDLYEYLKKDRERTI